MAASRAFATSYRDIAILLSGGVDSSLLAAKAAGSGFRTCVALTARWPGDNPELEAAASVARHVGIEHRIIDIDESYIEKSFPWIIWRLEEPPRHFNSFVLAKLFGAASGQFDTLLSGHAADVLFGPPGIIGLGVFRRRLSQLEYVPRRSEGRIWPHCWDIPGDSALPTSRSAWKSTNTNSLKVSSKLSTVAKATLCCDANFGHPPRVAS